MISTEMLEPGRMQVRSDNGGIQLALGLPDNHMAIADMTDEDALKIIEDLLALVTARDILRLGDRPPR